MRATVVEVDSCSGGVRVMLKSRGWSMRGLSFSFIFYMSTETKHPMQPPCEEPDQGGQPLTPTSSGVFRLYKRDKVMRSVSLFCLHIAQGIDHALDQEGAFSIEALDKKRCVPLAFPDTVDGSRGTLARSLRFQ